MPPTWISHRGYKADAVENTRDAFRAAVAAGFSALETDLRLSRDGHIVLHHDPDLRRLALRPELVAALSRKELERVELIGGARLMFLDEFIEAFPGCSWTFDVKPENGAETVRALDQWARAKGSHDWLMEQSKFVLWRHEHERLLFELFPKARFYAQERECWRAGIAAITGLGALGGIKPGRTYALPPRLGKIELYRPDIVRRFKQRGATTVAFLPETDTDARGALGCGIDEILTNGLIVRDAAGGSARA